VATRHVSLMFPNGAKICRLRNGCQDGRVSQPPAQHVVDRPADGEPLRSYKRRTSRLTPGQADALERLWPLFGIDMDRNAGMLDAEQLFGRTAPLVLEIGFGMGEATCEMAATQPGVDVLAIDVHTPGLGAVLREIEALGLTNVRVADGDANVLLRARVAPQSLHEVRIFFPDPWPKTRHRKRRMVDDRFLSLVADRLVPGGRLHLATDWAPYAERVRRLVADHAAYDLTDEVPWRARTRFEQQGTQAGRPAHEIVAIRR
jgi:tRNA (guanine-N7-)-methyltransferase